jgi:parallel beta-helix repeat protein
MLKRTAPRGLAIVVLALAVIAGAAAAGETDPASSELSATEPSMQRAIEAAELEQRQAEAYRDSAAGRAERADSQDAFVDQPDDQALATARAEFPELVKSPPLRWPELGADQEIDHYLSPTTAVVDEPGRKDALLQSDLPLRGETPDGHSAPLDMGLSDAGDTFQAKSTAAAVELPKRSDDTLRFPDRDLGIEVPGVEPTDARVTSNKLFFANALDDADMVVEPQPRGAEISFVLRSPDSPTDPALRFDMPAGAELRLAGDGTAADVVRDGSRLATVDPASAVDAQGKEIPVSYEVDGARLVMHVAVDGDVAWPVMVDPTTHVYDNNGQSVGSGSPGFTWPGWTAASNRTPLGCPATTQPFYECKNTDGSLSIWGITTASPAYAVLDYGSFIKHARSGTYIYSFHAANMSHTMQKSWTMGGICDTPCTTWMPGHWWTPLDKLTGVAKQGSDADRLIGGSYAGQTDYFCYDPTAAAPTTSCSLSNFVNSGLQTNDTVRWGMLMTGGNPLARPTASIGGAATLSSDNLPPKIVSVTHSNTSSGWVKSYTDTVTLRAADNNALLADNGYTYGSDLNANGQPLQGIGLGTVSVSGPGAGGTQSANCTTTNAYDSCPEVLTFPGTTYTAPEGTSTYTPSATDVVGNSQNGTTWTVKVDKTPPTGSFTNVPAYTNGTASITGTMSDALSGPQDAKVQYQAPGSTAWVDACARQATPSAFTCSWNTAGLADGTYQVRAELRDNTSTPGPNVGWTDGATVVVDHSPPQPLSDIAPSVGSTDYSDELTDGDLTEVSFTQHDVTSGVAQTVVDYNTATDGTESGEWVAADAAPAIGDGNASTFWDSSELSDGLHRVRATTTDRAGNSTVYKYQVVQPKGHLLPCPNHTCFAGFGYGKASYGGEDAWLPEDASTSLPCDLWALPGANDGAATGSVDKPFGTVLALSSALGKNQVGCLQQGTYVIHDGTNEGKLTNGKGITLQSAGGQTATIRGRLWLYGDNITLRNLKLDSRNLDNNSSTCQLESAPCPNPSPTVQGSNDALIGNEITSHGDDDPCFPKDPAEEHQAEADASYPYCQPAYQSNHPEFKDRHTICVDLTAKDQGNGNFADPEDVLIKGNYIHDCGVPTHANEFGAGTEASGGHWHGIYVGNADRTRIVNNVLAHNADRGIQLYPDAQHTTVQHNTLYNNGMGIDIGVRNTSVPKNNKIKANIVSFSRAGAGDKRYSQDPIHNVYNVYTNGFSKTDDPNNTMTGKNCLFQSGGSSGYSKDTTVGLTITGDPTVADPRFRNPANEKWFPTNPRCSRYGAVATYFKAFGIRDTLTAPSFAGTATDVGHTWIVAGRIQSAARRAVETGVTNAGPCNPPQRQSSAWYVYAKWRDQHGQIASRCPTTLPRSNSGTFKVAVRSDNKDVVVLPGRAPLILNHKTNANVPLKPVLVEAFAKTTRDGGNIGGVWSNVEYLTGPQGQGTWTTPNDAHTFDLTSWDSGYAYLPKPGTSNEFANFCVLGPKQGGTCP